MCRLRPPKALFLISGLLLAACSESEPAMHPGLGHSLPPSPDYNVLVISFDALRADALGLYGYPRDTSPNLDRFAGSALVFDNAYTAAPVTPTSFAGAFTGRYPFRTFLGWRLVPTTTIASRFQEFGYRTFGLFNNIQLAKERGFDQGFEIYEVGGWDDTQALVRSTELLNEMGQEKFFGWVHFISPHTPYDFREMSSGLAPAQSGGRYARGTGGRFDIRSRQELQRVRTLYDGEVYFADHLFGELMSSLTRLGLLEKTIVVVTSDHGEEFMEHGGLQHDSLFEEVTRIPLIIRHPRMRIGTRTRAPAINTDLFPTLSAMMGARPPTRLDGVDLSNPFPLARTRIITSMTDKHDYQIAIERARTKLIVPCSPRISRQVYDLVASPLEKVNIGRDRPGLAASLFDDLVQRTGTDPCRTIEDASLGKHPGGLLHDRQLEWLRSLGYLG